MIDILLPFKFLIVWIMMFTFHELMHSMEGWRQGSTKSNITVHHDRYSMTVTSDKITNRNLYNLAGGLYTSIVCMFIAVTTNDFSLRFSFSTLGVVNFFYSLYEWRYLGKTSYNQYTTGRYILYMLVLTVCFIVWGLWYFKYY